MTLREILEEDRERFMRAAGDARNAGEAADAVRDELGRMLAVYNEQADSDAEREAARQMLTACAGAAGLTDSAGEPVIYTKGGQGAVSGSGSSITLPAPHAAGADLPAAGGGRKGVLLPGKAFRKSGIGSFLRRAAQVIFPAAGAACLGAVPISLLLTGQAALMTISVPGVFLLTALGGVFLYLSGRQRAVLSALPAEQITCFAEVTPDPERIFHHLTTMAAVLDQNLAEARGSRRIAERSAQSDPDAGADPEFTELMSGLLETVYAQEDKDAARDITSEIRYYLHGKGIEAADYDGSNGAAFDLLPGQEEETLRPAMMKNGRVLRKGLAVRKTGE